MRKSNPLIIRAGHQPVCTFGSDMGSLVMAIEIDALKFFGDASHIRTPTLEEEALSVLGKPGEFPLVDHQPWIGSSGIHDVEAGIFGKGTALIHIATLLSVSDFCSVRRKRGAAVNAFFLSQFNGLATVSRCAINGPFFLIIPGDKKNFFAVRRERWFCLKICPLGQSFGRSVG